MFDGRILMSLLAFLKNALFSVRSFPLQSILSILSIAIGTGAIILIGNLGESLNQSVQKFNLRESKSSILVRSDATFDELIKGEKVSISPDLGDTLKRYFPQIQSVTTMVTMGGRIRKIMAGDEEFEGRVFGTNANWAAVTSNNIQMGRFLAISDQINRNEVCVLGNAFHRVPNVIGKTIRIDDFQCKAIGILEPRGKIIEDFDSVVIIPLSVVESRSKSRDEIDTELILSPYNNENFDKLVPKIRKTLRTLFKRTDHQLDGFLLIDSKGVREYIEYTLSKITIILTSLIGIALVVAGLGVFSLVYSGVISRTNEIGIRRAVGATPFSIALQFLIEAAMITLFGGFCGIVIGFLATAGLVAYSSIIPEFIINWTTVGMSMIGAISLGIVCSIWPAFRAAQLDPITALAYE